MGGRAAEIPGELDFLVADRGDAGESAGHVGLHQVANCIELKPDFFEAASLKKDVRGGASASVATAARAAAPSVARKLRRVCVVTVRGVRCS